MQLNTYFFFNTKHLSSLYLYCIMKNTIDNAKDVQLRRKYIPYIEGFYFMREDLFLYNFFNLCIDENELT